MSFKASLKDRPIIYEIVPPRRDTAKFNTELAGVEGVLNDSRIIAINIPELMNRKEESGQVVYSPATIPPEVYALMVRDRKEAIVNIVAPRLERAEFSRRIDLVLHEYGITNLVLVGKEKHGDLLPGPSVIEALAVLKGEKDQDTAIGGICIFNRQTSTPDEYGGGGSMLGESSRTWQKGQAGCDFVTSQIIFNSKPALDFLSSYQELCQQRGTNPLTVFISLTTVPSPSILSLLEGLDVVVPPEVRERLTGTREMGRESLKIAGEVFEEIITGLDERGLTVPIGLQIEQVGVNSGDLSLALLDKVYPTLKK